MHKEALAVPAHTGGYYHAGAVFGNCNFFYLADLDFLVLDLRLAGFESISRIEGDSDGRPALKNCPDRKSASNDSRYYRYEPDQLDGPAPFRFGYRWGDIRSVFFIRCPLLFDDSRLWDRTPLRQAW
jgi:hypothetical protein